MAWNGVGPYCLMNPSRSDAEHVDGFLNLHNAPWDTSEYRRVRRRPEPLPIAFQPDFYPNP